MKLKKRCKVFETNSSSIHSLLLDWSNPFLVDTSLVPRLDGSLLLLNQDFGWEIEDYYDALTKASYCAIDFRGHPGLMWMLDRVLRKITGCKEVIYPEDGYIDHQSDGNARELFENNETSLENFIFNKNSCLHTDNDGY